MYRDIQAKFETINIPNIYFVNYISLAL